MRRSTLLAVCIAVSGATTTPADDGRAKAPSAPPRVTAENLISGYAFNIAFAKSAYSGKKIEVEGEFFGVYESHLFSKDAGYGYVVVMMPGRRFEKGRVKSWVYIHCLFPKKAKKGLAKLTPGQTVVISGKCKGWEVPDKGDVNEDTRIPVYKCKIIPRPPAK